MRPLPHSASHLPALAANANARTTTHPAPPHRHHTMGTQNARMQKALQATMSDTKLSRVMAEAQRQRDVFTKRRAGATRTSPPPLLRHPPSSAPAPALSSRTTPRSSSARGPTRLMAEFGCMGLMMTRPPATHVTQRAAAPFPRDSTTSISPLAG
ncbi:hypothetical protein B0H11DRAFT_2297473 [Mycena galericulata]|nr:hypothetical protein B0H11DRAFT_2297473 [Mycena galericulata]